MASAGPYTAKTPIWVRFLPLVAALTGFIVPGYRFFPPSPGMITAFAALMVFLLLAGRAIPEDRKIWNTAAALQLGYLACGIYYLIATNNYEFLSELIITTAYISWLYIRPGIWPVIVACIFQFIGTINVTKMLLPTITYQETQILLVVHTLFRTAAIYFMVIAYLKLRRQRQSQLLLQAAQVFD